MQYTKIGSGPLLVYVSGLDGTGQLFFRQAEALSSKYTVITFTLRNQGTFEYTDLWQDVLRILDLENAGRATLVAESFGGTIALQFALKHPERIEHLVLVNTFSYFRKRFLLQLGRFLLPLAFVPVVRWGRDILAKPFLTNEQVDETGTRKLLEFSWTHNLETYRHRMRLISEHDVRERLAEIRIPVTIIAARKDRLVPSVHEAHFMAERIPHANLHILPDHGHACLLSHTFSLMEIL